MSKSKSFNLKKLTENYSELINEIGENPKREGLLKTPSRAAKSLLFLTNGYEEDALLTIKSAIFNEDHNEMVIVKNIEFYSLCEHHLLPFFGKVHVAYIPNKKIVGLSKIPRVVDIFSHRLQVQERLTTEILNCLDTALKPQGVAVILEAQHLCMQMRGVMKQNSVTITSSFKGVFKNEETRKEFLNLISKNN